MTGSVIVCAMFAAGAAPVPQVPANQAPPPRLVRPDASLVVVEELRVEDDSSRPRVRSIGFRTGKPLPAEVIWDSHLPAITHFHRAEIRANRYAVSMCWA